MTSSFHLSKNGGSAKGTTTNAGAIVQGSLSVGPGEDLKEIKLIERDQQQIKN